MIATLVKFVFIVFASLFLFGVLAVFWSHSGDELFWHISGRQLVTGIFFLAGLKFIGGE